MRTTDKTILVTGATGQQGGATAAKLLADGWRVRALVRDAEAPAASALAEAGAELAVGDLDDAASLEAAMRGVHGVYSVQIADEHELSRGKRVADVAVMAGVNHLVYMSVGGLPGQIAYHANVKWDIENYLRGLDLSVTILRPAGFMVDFTTGRFGVTRGELTVPIGPEVPVTLIAVEDIGAFAALAFAQPKLYIGQALEIAGDAITPPQIAAAVSEALGRTIPYVEVPLSLVREKAPAAADVYEWVNAEFYTVDLEDLRARHPGLMDFETWLAKVGGESLRHNFAA